MTSSFDDVVVKRYFDPYDTRYTGKGEEKRTVIRFLTESSKSPASIAQSNKQWVGTCLYQEWYKPLLISCEAAIRL